jgi:hypothetical protein
MQTRCCSFNYESTFSEGKHMCFSAQASFLAAGFLITLGSLTLKRRSPHNSLLATTPLLFGIQQLSEGVVWSTFGSQIQFFHQLALYVFLACALVLWPVWVPLSLIQCEQMYTRKNILYAILIAGSLFSLYALYSLFTLKPFATVEGHHIIYHVFPPPTSFTYFIVHIGLYLCATIVPFFISSHPGTFIMGICITIASIVSWLFWHYAFVSTWCFLAAILSCMILFIVTKYRTR